jgi:hypothetical protein
VERFERRRRRVAAAEDRDLARGRRRLAHRIIAREYITARVA